MEETTEIPLFHFSPPHNSDEEVSNSNLFDPMQCPIVPSTSAVFSFQVRFTLL
jgi:hypothetical protein